MEQNRGGSQQQIITQQMEVDGIKVEGSETSTIVLEDQEMKESQVSWKRFARLWDHSFASAQFKGTESKKFDISMLLLS